ncbi:heavy-metal-associated domain-containing protein [Streptomyces lancefieldiae]|uniref:Heavy-metal-associated domain-containing protein n=1 Tax=Streptomyces lancefieldiae TaxID=3075520 RepID=A0ABU3AUG5_9ACTN|nr:heavy-metal-associated domain-containing protein [Streptomyces sp. DSM 40712]MDT0613485.1 heavy-metal-associated domain-containing protein [Streptomyces sp. DSM 40712]
MSCCTPDGSCSTTGTATATAGVTTVYNVSGMTCGHCKATLTKEIGALEGVLTVDVDLETGQVAVTTADEPDDALVAKVVDDAGYELTGRAA